MVTAHPEFERVINLVNGFKFITKKLISDSSKHSLYFTAVM